MEDSAPSTSIGKNKVEPAQTCFVSKVFRVKDLEHSAHVVASS